MVSTTRVLIANTETYPLLEVQYPKVADRLQLYDVNDQYIETVVVTSRANWNPLGGNHFINFTPAVSGVLATHYFVKEYNFSPLTFIEAFADVNNEVGVISLLSKPMPVGGERVPVTGIIDPSTDKIRYRMKNFEHEDWQVKDILTYLLDQAGVEYAAGAFSEFTDSANFMIPYSGNYENYLTYIQDLVKSSLGYLYLDDDYKINGKKFVLPSTSNEITEADMIGDKGVINIEYKDIVTRINFENKFYNSSDISTNSTFEKTDTLAEYLHGQKKALTFNHLLKNISTIGDDLIDMLSKRKLEYRIKTKNKNFDSKIGDETKVDTNLFDSNKSYSIIEIDKKGDETELTLTDLLGL